MRLLLTEGKARIASGNRVWREEDHPRDPETGRFVEKITANGLNFLRISPVRNAMDTTKVKYPDRRVRNASATDIDGLPEEHVQKMAEVLAEETTNPEVTTYEQIVENVRALWEQTPAERRRDGMVWYRAANSAGSAMASDHGVTHEQANGVIAALSPQQAWGGNVALADFVIGAWSANPVIDMPSDVIESLLHPEPARRRRPDGTEYVTRPAPVDLRPLQGLTLREAHAQFPEEVGHVVNAMQKAAGDPEDPGLRANYPGHEERNLDGSFTKVAMSAGVGVAARAFDILAGGPGAVDDVLNGHKVRSFFNNINDPDDISGRGDVTVDTHAVMAALNILQQPRTKEEREEAKAVKNASEALLSGTPTDLSLGVQGTYALFASAYRQVAREVPMPPNQLQAAIWLHWRDMKKGSDDE